MALVKLPVMCSNYPHRRRRRYIIADPARVVVYGTQIAYFAAQGMPVGRTMSLADCLTRQNMRIYRYGAACDVCPCFSYNDPTGNGPCLCPYFVQNDAVAVGYGYTVELTDSPLLPLCPVHTAVTRGMLTWTDVATIAARIYAHKYGANN